MNLFFLALIEEENWPNKQRALIKLWLCKVSCCPSKGDAYGSFSLLLFDASCFFFSISFAGTGSSCVQVRGTSKHQGRSFLQERASLFFSKSSRHCWAVLLAHSRTRPSHELCAFQPSVFHSQSTSLRERTDGRCKCVCTILYHHQINWLSPWRSKRTGVEHDDTEPTCRKPALNTPCFLRYIHVEIMRVRGNENRGDSTAWSWCRQYKTLV